MEKSSEMRESSLSRRTLHNKVFIIGATALASGLLALSAIGQHNSPPSEDQLFHDSAAGRFVGEHGDEAAAISSGLLASSAALQGATLIIRRRRENS